MKTLFALLCLLFAGYNVKAQDIALQKHYADSVSALIAVAKDDTNKVLLLHRLAHHTYWFDSTAAREHVSNATVLSNKLGFTRGHSRSFLLLGNFFEYSKQYDKALEMYSSAAFHAEKGKLYTESHDAYISLINIHFYKGEYVYALDVCLKGLKLSREADDLRREADYTNLSGFIYRNMKQAEDEEKAFRKYAVLARKSGDSLLVASACTELAQVMMEQKKFDSAELFLDTAYQLYSGHYETHRRAFIHYLRAKIYLETGVREAAFTNAKLAIRTSQSAPSNEFDVARYYIITGKALFQMRLFDDALLYLDTGLSISTRIHHQENIRDAYQLIAYSFDQAGNSDSAFRYLSLYNSLQDSLLNEENLRAIAEMNARFHLENAERDLSILQQAESENARRRYFIIGIAVMGMIVLFLIYNRYRLKQKNDLQLTINRQQNELFHAVLSAQEKERQRIAGDLHDGLGSLLSSAKLQLNLMKDEGSQKHLEAAYELIDRSSNDLRSISHAIMPASLTKLGLSSALAQVIGGFESNNHIKFSFHAHGMEERLNNETELALYNVAMELLNNTVKHAKAGNVTVQLIRHESHVNLTVEDDGAGFEVSKAVSGIGLSNIRSRVVYLKGSIEIDSQPGKGTTVSIDVPVL